MNHQLRKYVQRTLLKQHIVVLPFVNLSCYYTQGVANQTHPVGKKKIWFTTKPSTNSPMKIVFPVWKPTLVLATIDVQDKNEPAKMVQSSIHHWKYANILAEIVGVDASALYHTGANVSCMSYIKCYTDDTKLKDPLPLNNVLQHEYIQVWAWFIYHRISMLWN